MSLLRGCINLQVFARHPVACVFLSLRDLRGRFAVSGRTAPGSLCTLQSCCFPARWPQLPGACLVTRCPPRIWRV